jgi:hypothetical protein
MRRTFLAVLNLRNKPMLTNQGASHMKLSLKNVKHTEWASEETHCYQASLYVDGKPVAVVSNEGRGGGDRDYQHSKFKGDYRAKMTEVREHFSALPPVVCELFEDGYPQCLEGWCCEEINTWLAAREFRGKMRNNTLFQKEGSTDILGMPIRQTSTDGSWSNGLRILNDMAFADAFKIWQEYSS